MPGPETGDGPMLFGVLPGFSGMLSEGAPEPKPQPGPKSDRPIEELDILGDDKSGNGDEGIFMFGPGIEDVLVGYDAGPWPVIIDPELF